MSGPVSDPLGRPPRFKPRPHKLGGLGLDERKLTAIGGDEQIVTRAIRIGGGACAIRLDGIRAGDVLVVNNILLPRKKRNSAKFSDQATPRGPVPNCIGVWLRTFSYPHASKMARQGEGSVAIRHSSLRTNYPRIPPRGRYRGHLFSRIAPPPEVRKVL